MSNKKVSLLVNGPGELWGWARPLCRQMIQRGWIVSIHLLPCPFASGLESEVARGIPGVSFVFEPKGLFGTLLSLRRHRANLVVQLGGDLLFGRAMASFHSVPLACYSYGNKSGLGRCDLVATAFDSMAKHMKCPALVTGDLVADGLDMDVSPSPWSESRGDRLVFFPGSRPAIREAAREYLAETLRLLKHREGLQFVSLLSPFSRETEVRLWRDSGLNPFIGGTGSALDGADLAVTQPGTNTLELMHRAVPALVAVPFSFIRQVPLSGLAGMILSLPGGSALKEKILRKKAANRKGYLAWPNRIAGREVFPELVGDLSPSDMAKEIDRLLDDRHYLSKTRNILRAMTDKKHPASRLSDALERLIS